MSDDINIATNINVVEPEKANYEINKNFYILQKKIIELNNKIKNSNQ